MMTIWMRPSMEGNQGGFYFLQRTMYCIYICDLHSYIYYGCFPSCYSADSRSGLFQKGGMELLAVQALAVLCITAWSAISTFILLKVRPDDAEGEIVDYSIIN